MYILRNYLILTNIPNKISSLRDRLRPQTPSKPKPAGLSSPRNEIFAEVETVV
jgi:hypothetical protein